MARKRFSDEECYSIVATDFGSSVAKACRSAGVSDATYYG